MRKKIGIMGGTFNPIHNGHLLLAENAREILELDKVIFMPTGNSYMKNASSILNGEERLKMIELAIEGNPHFSISRIELDRKGATYTCETLSELRKINSEDQYYFIMGADSLLMLETWKNPESILQNCIVVAALRGSGTEKEIADTAKYLMHKYYADIKLLPARYIDISSSDIRFRLQEGKSIRYMLPDKVLAYIKEKELYYSKGDSFENC